MTQQVVRVPVVAKVALLVAVAGMTSGCAADQLAAASDEGESKGPALVVNEPTDAFFEAIVSGVVGVNEQNCVTLDDEVLVAPAGSRMAEGGAAILLKGYSAVAVGDGAQFAGGHEELTRDQAGEDIRNCASPQASEINTVSVSPYGLE